MPQTSAGYRGELCIVSLGDDLTQELVYDHSTQLEADADGYLWDGEYDFSYHENEVEVDFNDFNIIWEDSGFEDAKDLEVEYCCQDAEVETCYDAEVCYYETCFDDEVVFGSDAEVEDCDYDAEDYCDY